MKTPFALAMSTMAVVLAVCAGPAGAEVFELANGGRVIGQLLNPEEIPRETYNIQIAPGTRLSLLPRQVQQVLYPRDEEQQYARIRPQFADTPEGQWALAEWCRENNLLAQREKHLERIIELAPDHADARRALGYSQIGGRWATQEQVMTERGYEFYRGRWRTPQEIRLMKQRRETDLAEKDWAQKIKRWRDWLSTDRAAEARRELLSIDDPYAVEALARNFEDEPAPAVRLLYVEALAKIGTPEAVKTLAARSLEDPVDEVRLTCLDHLERIPSPEVAAFYVGKLRAKDNRLVNLAAMALGRLKEPSTVGPLIDALVTEHKYKIVKAGGSGSMSTTFSSTGGGGMSMGGGPKIITRQLRNQAALDALVAITGQNFYFDERTWKHWLSMQRGRPSIDARRD